MFSFSHLFCIYRNVILRRFNATQRSSRIGRWHRRRLHQGSRRHSVARVKYARILHELGIEQQSEWPFIESIRYAQNVGRFVWWRGNSQYSTIPTNDPLNLFDLLLYHQQGALIGCGASLFGIGSDIAGSIRVPAMFNGIFGHKPTGGLLSVEGHFPYSKDESFRNYLVVGPMCRYAKDLPTLMHIMAGPNADKLRLNEPLYTKDIKVSMRIPLTRQRASPINIYSRFSYDCTLDFLQRGLGFVVGWHSGTAGDENCNASGRQAFPIERSWNKRSCRWIAAEAHRMRTRSIFPNARYSVDHSRWQCHTKTGQYFPWNGEEYFWKIQIQFCRSVFLLFIRNKWTDSKTKDSKIPENWTAGATTTSGKFEKNKIKHRMKRAVTHAFQIDCLPTLEMIVFNSFFFLVLFRFSLAGDAWRQRCSILSHISSISGPTQRLVFQVVWRFIHDDIQFVWFSIDACSARTRSQRDAHWLPSGRRPVSRPPLHVYCCWSGSGLRRMETSILEFTLSTGFKLSTSFRIPYLYVDLP